MGKESCGLLLSVFLSKLHLASPSVLCVVCCDLLSAPTGISNRHSPTIHVGSVVVRQHRQWETINGEKTAVVGSPNRLGHRTHCGLCRLHTDNTHYSNKVSMCLRYSCNCRCLTQYCINRSRSSDTQKRDVHFSRWHRCLSVLRTKFVNMCKTRQEICIFYFANTHRFKTTTPPPFPFARSTSKGRSVPSPLCCRVAARSRQMYNLRHVSLHLMHARTYCYKQ